MIVQESVVPRAKRLLQKSYVVVKLLNLLGTHIDLALALLLHLLESLGAVLEEIHFEEVVFLELLEVFPEFLLLNGHFVITVRVAGIQVDVRCVERIPKNNNMSHQSSKTEMLLTLPPSFTCWCQTWQMRDFDPTVHLRWSHS